MANRFYRNELVSEDVKNGNVVIYSILTELQSKDGKVEDIKNKKILSWIDQIKKGTIGETWPGLKMSGADKQLKTLITLLDKSQNRIPFKKSSILLNSLNYLNQGYVDEENSKLSWKNYKANDENNKLSPLMSALQCVDSQEDNPLGLDFYMILQELVKGGFKINANINEKDKIDLANATRAQLKMMHKDYAFNELFTNPHKRAKNEDPIESGE